MGDSEELVWDWDEARSTNRVVAMMTPVGKVDLQPLSQ